MRHQPRATGYNHCVDSAKIAIIGGGNMGRALLGGLLRDGTPRGQVRIGEASGAARHELHREFGVFVSDDNAAVLEGAAIAVIAVKPQDAEAVLVPLGARLREQQSLVVSVAAGIEVRSLQAWCGTPVAVVRAMPNRPALVGAGVTALYAPAGIAVAQRALAEHVMRAVGAVVWLADESALDVVTALSGSGPAYFFLLAEQMMAAAVLLGLEPAAARTLAVETLHGAGVLAHAGDGDLARLRAGVTSKGGTTEAALQVLDGAQGIGPLVQRALAAAADRSRELAARFAAKGHG